MLLSISELTHQSWNNYLKTLRYFTPFIGILLLNLTIQYFLGFAGLFLNAYTNLSNLSVDIALALIIFALSIITVWTGLTILKSAQLILQNSPLLSFKEIYIETARYLLPTFFLSIVVGLIVMVGSILFLIPGIIFAIWYYFVNYVIVFDNQTNLSSLKTSKQLVVGRWFNIAFKIVIPKIFFLIGLTIVAFLLEKIIVGIFDPSAIKISLIAEFISRAIAAITLPLFIWSDTILYFNAKENQGKIEIPTITK